MWLARSFVDKSRPFAKGREITDLRSQITNKKQGAGVQGEAHGRASPRAEAECNAAAVPKKRGRKVLFGAAEFAALRQRVVFVARRHVAQNDR